MRWVVICASSLLIVSCGESDDKKNENADAGSSADAAALGSGRKVEDAEPAWTKLRAKRLELRDAYLDRLRDCGLIASDAETHVPLGLGDSGLCLLQCSVDASCDELIADECGATPASVQACVDACAKVECADGASLDEFDECNGSVECSDGSDESTARCNQWTVFECENGELIDIVAACDQGSFHDCEDGSDEVGCEAYRCEDSGAAFRLSDRCNLQQTCDDGTDERGCGGFACDNGLEVSWDYLCDGTDNCGDGSDEPSACAAPTCE